MHVAFGTTFVIVHVNFKTSIKVTGTITFFNDSLFKGPSNSVPE